VSPPRSSSAFTADVEEEKEDVKEHERREMRERKDKDRITPL